MSLSSFRDGVAKLSDAEIEELARSLNDGQLPEEIAAVLRQPRPTSNRPAEPSQAGFTTETSASARIHIGQYLLGTVTKITPLGAFVSLGATGEGLIPVSTLFRGKPNGRVDDVVRLGDTLAVKIAEISPQGRVALVPVGPDDAVGSSADAPPPQAETT